MKVLLLSAVFVTCADADFLWGSATAAYQVEGYRTADGRQRSIWDAFDTPNISSVIRSVKPDGETNTYLGQNAAVADNDYVNYPDSVKLLKSYGYKAARISLAWPRIMTYSKDEEGALVATPNEKGLKHYEEMLAAYKNEGIQTAVTIFHWDLPLAIEEKAASRDCGSAWLCHDLIVELFAEYAELVIGRYKHLTDWWITINEPLTVTGQGYGSDTGKHAPGRCTDRKKCWAGDCRTEPYMAAKGLILAHARAFRIWEKHGKPGRGCGITSNGDWRIPATDSEADRAAAQRAIEWQAPPFFDPIFFGRWPTSMVERVGSRLPSWSPEEVELVKGTHDGHLFINHYTAGYARAMVQGDDTECGFGCDAGAVVSGYDFKTKKPVGTPSSNGWLFNYGPGFGALVNWYNNRYPGVTFVITENGWGDSADSVGLNDLERCNYYRDYLGNLSATVAQNNIKVGAYFAWALLDNFEWNDGFACRFGVTFNDFKTGSRTPKLSAKWLQKYITPLKELPTDGKPLPACDMSLLEESSVEIV